MKLYPGMHIGMHLVFFGKSGVIKDFLSKPPVLTAPHKNELLLLYLAATTHVVSTAIVVER
jgi:hypothetical protein